MKWSTATLDSVAILDRQSVHPSELDSETPYLGLEHLDGDGGINCVETVDSAELKSNKFHFTDKHILFGKLRPYLRKIVRPSFSGICSTDIIPILPGKELSRDYLFYFLRTPAIVELATSRCSGANLPRLSPKQLASFQIPLPPLAEQKRIAGILDAADALRAKRHEALAQLDALLQSIFLDLFGDPVLNPMGWEIKPLEQVCEKVIDCPHSTPKWNESGVICLRTSNLGKGEWIWDDTRYVTEQDYLERTKRSEIHKNDIILSREGTVGVLALVKDGMRLCMGQRLVQLRTMQQIVNPQFMVFLLLHDLAPERLSRLMAGSTSKHLNVRELRKLLILTPPLDLQRRFAAIVVAVERQKARQRAHLAELDTLFTALQQRAFTGEL